MDGDACGRGCGYCGRCSNDPREADSICADCGVDYSKGEHDRTVWCDDCSNRRDLHTSLLEIRLMMARAYRSTRPVKDVA